MKKSLIWIGIICWLAMGCAGGDDEDGRDGVRGDIAVDTPRGDDDDTDVIDPDQNDGMDDPMDPADPQDPTNNDVIDPDPMNNKDPEDPMVEPYQGWVKTFGGAGIDWPKAVASTALGNVVVAGSFDSSFNVEGETIRPLYGGSDAFVISFDTDGNLLWHVVYGSNGNDEAYGVATDADGSVYVVGDHAGDDTTFRVGSDSHAGLGGRDAHVIKLDPNGNRVWVRTMGDVRDDTAYSVAVYSAGQVAVTGRYTHKFSAGLESVQSPSPGYGNDVFVASLDTASGAVDWLEPLIGFGSDMGTSISVDENGGVVVGLSYQYDLDAGDGVSLSAAGAGFEVGLVAFDNLGVTRWAKPFTSTQGVALSGLVMDARGRVYVTGSFKGTFDLAPLSFTADGAFDSWVAAFETDGSFSWARHLSGAGIDQAMAVTLNGPNLYVTGRYTEGLGVEGESITAMGGYDGFLASFEAINGATRALTSFGGSEDEQPEGIANAADERGVFVSGYSSQTFMMDGQSYPSPGAGLDSFVIKAGH